MHRYIKVMEYFNGSNRTTSNISVIYVFVHVHLLASNFHKNKPLLCISHGVLIKTYKTFGLVMCLLTYKS